MYVTVFTTANTHPFLAKVEHSNIAQICLLLGYYYSFIF